MDPYMWVPILIIGGLGVAAVIALIVETRDTFDQIIDDELGSNVVPLPRPMPDQDGAR